MIVRNGGDPGALSHVEESLEAEKTHLAELWGIVDLKTARGAIQGLVSGGRRERYDEDFKRLQTGVSIADLRHFDGEDYLRWKKAMNEWTDAGMEVKAGLSMAAYDYERIGYLARNCLHAGYLTEQEAWRCLAWAAERAQKEFASWSEYAASFVLGRAATFSGDAQIAANVKAARWLLEGEAKKSMQPLWQLYPLPGLRVSEELLNAALEESSTPHDPLLALGALTAQAFGLNAAAINFDGDRNACKQYLAKQWNVADAASFLLRADGELMQGRRSQYQDTFARVANSSGSHQIEDVPALTQVRFFQAKKLLEDADFSAARATTLLGYDMEHAAFAVRIAVGAGYLDEVQARTYLRRIAMSVRGTFESWDDYFVASTLGSAFFAVDAEHLGNIVSAGTALVRTSSPFREHQSPWQQFPLTTLPMLQSVKH